MLETVKHDKDNDAGGDDGEGGRVGRKFSRSRKIQMRRVIK